MEFKDRIEDLCFRAERTGRVQSTMFLDGREQALAQGVCNHLGARCAFSGGWPEAERRCLFVLPDDFSEQISRYALFMCIAINAEAAERKYFGSCTEIRRLVMQSPLKDEMKKAKFRLVTKKSRISVFLIKNGLCRTAFAFLYLCRIIKNISGRKE